MPWQHNPLAKAELAAASCISRLKYRKRIILSSLCTLYIQTFSQFPAFLSQRPSPLLCSCYGNTSCLSPSDLMKRHPHSLNLNECWKVVSLVPPITGGKYLPFHSPPQWSDCTKASRVFAYSNRNNNVWRWKAVLEETDTSSNTCFHARISVID